jgi:hemerythrin
VGAIDVTQIVWSNAFEVGHEGLDSEHRRLVDLINAIYAAGSVLWSRNKVGSLLDDLSNAVRQHFRNENSILLNIGRRPIPSNVERLSFIKVVVDAALDKHIASHAQTLPQLRSILANIRSELDATEPHFNSDLSNWFIEHATVYDAHLRQIFEALKRPKI